MGIAFEKGLGELRRSWTCNTNVSGSRSGRISCNGPRGRLEVFETATSIVSRDGRSQDHDYKPQPAGTITFCCCLRYRTVDRGRLDSRGPVLVPCNARSAARLPGAFGAEETASGRKLREYGSYVRSESSTNQRSCAP